MYKQGYYNKENKTWHKATSNLIVTDVDSLIFTIEWFQPFEKELVKKISCQVTIQNNGNSKKYTSIIVPKNRYIL